MRLFEIVPTKFYSILNGKNKSIYVSSLILLYKLISENEMVIKKDEFSRALKEKLKTEIDDFSIEEEDTDLDSQSIAIGGKASIILRRLEETGWIVIELDPETLEEYIILPSYSIKSISTLFEIENESSEGYSSLVHTTYSELVLENNEKDEFMYATLLRAYQNTKQLRLDLITLSHSIRIYQNKLSSLYSSNDVLHSYYDNYKELISDRLYHPLKTFDSVTRFKRPIISMLSDWLKDEEIKNTLIRQVMVFNKNITTKEQAELEVIEKINYICDSYESLNKMIDQIDKSHRDYTKSSTNKILYLNNSDKSIKGCLETILTSFGKYKGSPKVLRDVLSSMQGSISLYDNGYINSDSVTLPFMRRFIYSQEPLQIMNEDLLTETAMQNFLSQVNGMFTDDMVFKFMEEVFEDRNELNIEDIKIYNFDILILIILATVKRSDPNAFYDVDFSSKEKVRTQGYIVPKLRFYRKDK